MPTNPRTTNDLSPRAYTPKHLADRILQSRSALEGERKQVTVLFADVKGSMELAEQLDPEQWHSILDRFFAILTDGVHRFEGTVNQYTGDGIMALFGAPIAHEDHAQRACYAALHLRDAVREYADEVRVRHGVPFGVRIGLNSGDVIVGKIGDDLRMDYTAQGHVVGLAQRMEALAESGHIAASQHTARLVTGYFQLRDLGRTKVKGVSEPVGLFDLEGVGPFRTRLDRSRARGLSTFVGRDSEMALLEAALQSALAGHGRIVGVVAQAGVGKSRLCFEFTESCRARGIVVHEAHCPAHGKTVAHLPVLELLRSYFGLADGDSARVAREKIAGRLLLLDRAFDNVLPLIWDFLRVPDPGRPVEELDAAVRQQQLYEFSRRLVRARSEREPAVLFFDDLHWIDPASDAFLAQLVEAVRGTRTLLLVNFRPEYRADWMQRSDYQQLPLTPLSSEAMRALLEQLLGKDPSVGGLPTVIEARTAGNPFYTEEVVSALIEAEQLVGSPGAYRLVGSVDRVEIPPTVQAVLAARIDRLAEREKRVLQTAGIIGKNFARPLLAQIIETHDRAPLAAADLDGALRLLCDLDFLFERALYPVAEYAFKHPLTHEVAYGSQLQERRRAVHAALARVLEAGHDAPALLAHHWDEAGEMESAAHWHREAALDAGMTDADSAVRHWERACDLLGQLPETRERLSAAGTAHAQLLWIETRRGTAPERARALFEQAHKFTERAGDLSSLAHTRFAYANHLLYSGQPGSREEARQALAEAERAADVAMQIAASWVCTATSFFTEDISLAVRQCERGIALCDDNLDLGAHVLMYSPWIFLRALGGGAMVLSGRLAEGAALIAQALGDHGQRYYVSQAICGGFAVIENRIRGEYRAALAVARRSLDSFTALGGTRGGHVWLLFHLGQALALNGDVDGARDALDRTRRLTTEIRTFRHMLPDIQTWLAHIALAVGDTDLARRELDAGFEHARRQKLVVPLVYAHVVRARLLRMEGKVAEHVEPELAEAVRLAVKVGAHGLVPEIHSERAALLQRDGRIDDARRELDRARDLYGAMGAGPNADRMAVQIETLPR
ncbi:MAG TPA: adenylate/guanylate cyclase domain-containing protein [Candidatus Margulisiibacteriota bacterium]|nr:adenylate/guanylate cyclase domain-containing protein [Candidatus Margulisiibacteriota bacterium]